MAARPKTSLAEIYQVSPALAAGLATLVIRFSFLQPLPGLPRVIDGDHFHRAANLVHPDLPVAEHDAPIAGEQIVRLGGGDRPVGHQNQPKHPANFACALGLHAASLVGRLWRFLRMSQQRITLGPPP